MGRKRKHCEKPPYLVTKKFINPDFAAKGETKSTSSPYGWLWCHEANGFCIVRPEEGSLGPKDRIWSNSMIPGMLSAEDLDTRPEIVEPFPFLGEPIQWNETKVLIQNEELHNKRLKHNCDAKRSNDEEVQTTSADNAEMGVKGAQNEGPENLLEVTSGQDVKIQPRNENIQNTNVEAESPRNRDGNDGVEHNQAQEPAKHSELSNASMAHISISQLPTLEHFIQDEFLPDFLKVENVDRLITNPNGHDSKEQKDGTMDCRTYKRFRPPLQGLASESEETTILNIGERIGEGNHSAAFQAAWTLPEQVKTLPGVRKVKVVVKVANDDEDDRKFLERESIAYQTMSLPRFNKLQSDWSGYVVCDGPFGYARDLMNNGARPTISALSAVVPKFYGYYIPLADVQDETNPSPILLMEDCGQSVYDFKGKREYWDLDWETQVHIEMTLKCQIPTMYASLHSTGFLQNSAKYENFAIKPGPLSLPVAKRSYKTPSLRIIDFGRWRVRDDEIGSEWTQEDEGIRHPVRRFEECAMKELTRASKIVKGKLSCVERECYCSIRENNKARCD